MLQKFGGSGHPESPDFVEKVLSKAGEGEPGLSVESVDPDIGTQHVVYRDKAGKPIVVAKIVQDTQGNNLVMDLAADKSRGLLTGRASKAVAEKLQEIGATESAGTMSADAENFLSRMKEHLGAGESTPVTRITDKGLPFTSDKPETWVVKGLLDEAKANELNEMYKAGKGDIHRGNIEGPINFNATDEFGNEIAPVKSEGLKFTPEEKPLLPPSGGNAPQFNPPGRSGLTGRMQQLYKSEKGELIIPGRQQELPLDKESVFKEPEAQANIRSKAKLRSQEQLPFEGGPLKTPPKASALREMTEMAHQLVSVDLPFTTSAAFRQASPLVGTTNWFKSSASAAKSYGSQEAFDAIMNRIKNDPFVRENSQGVSIARDKMGIRLTDLGELTNREEYARSQWAEKLPWVKASNRAYTAFLNDLRVNQAKKLMEDAGALGLKPYNNAPLMRELGEYINVATGRASLGKFERIAPELSNTLFSPRLMASRIQMMNPANYVMGNPFVRKQYMYGLLRAVGGWGALASLASMAGADVSTDPTNSDFGKIKIGNTRIDPGSGFQQFLVLGARGAAGGKTSSTSGRFTEFGKGYKPETFLSTVGEFASNKLRPELKFAVDLLTANKQRPFFLGDRTLQLAIPMVVNDLRDLAKEDSDIAMMIGIPVAALGTAGMGVQTYDKRSSKQPIWTNPEFDVPITKSPFSSETLRHLMRRD